MLLEKDVFTSMGSLDLPFCFWYYVMALLSGLVAMIFPKYFASKLYQKLCDLM